MLGRGGCYWRYFRGVPRPKEFYLVTILFQRMLLTHLVHESAAYPPTDIVRDSTGKNSLVRSRRYRFVIGILSQEWTQGGGIQKVSGGRIWCIAGQFISLMPVLGALITQKPTAADIPRFNRGILTARSFRPVDPCFPPSPRHKDQHLIVSVFVGRRLRSLATSYSRPIQRHHIVIDGHRLRLLHVWLWGGQTEGGLPKNSEFF